MIPPGRKPTRLNDEEENADAVLQRYKETRRLRGSFGPVWHVTSKRSPKTWRPKEYIVKQIQLSRFTSNSFRQEAISEAQVMLTMSHSKLVSVRHVKLSRKYLYIITEACTGGTLHERAPYSERQAKDVIKQITQALGYIHNRGYIHKNLTVRVMVTSPQSQTT